VEFPGLPALQDEVDFLPVCPELAIGLPVPRPALRLVQKGGTIRLIRTDTGQDLTAAMAEFCRRFFLRHPDASAAVLKERSPSCGIANTVVYDASGRALRRTGWGLFAASCRTHLAGRPVVPSARVSSPAGAQWFLARLDAGARTHTR